MSIAQFATGLIATTLLLVIAGCGDPDAAADSAGAEQHAAVGESVQSELEPGAEPEVEPDAASGDGRLGPAVSEPERYYGTYAAAGRPGREWFITEARNPVLAERAPPVPPGHLMLGAMFGDVAPWHLKTLSETEFVQARVNPGQSEPIAIEFRLDADGSAEAFRFTGGSFADDAWLERTGDLPSDW